MTATFWDNRSKKYDDSIRKHGAVYDKTMKSSRSLLTHSDVVLDFACASGEMSFDIAPHVKQVHGIDSSLKMIELAKQKALFRQIENTSFAQTDVFDLKLASDSFSAIVAYSIFHLLIDAPKVLDRLYDLLAPGGLLISETPCLGESSWIFRAFIGLAQKVRYAPPILSLTVDRLESLLTNSNFEIIESTLWDEKAALQWVVARKSLQVPL